MDAWTLADLIDQRMTRGYIASAWRDQRTGDVHLDIKAHARPGSDAPGILAVIGADPDAATRRIADVIISPDAAPDDAAEAIDHALARSAR